MKKCLFFLLIFSCVQAVAQFSKTHYIPPLSSSINVIPEEQFLYISTPNATPVNFRIINLGGAVINGTVSRDVPYVYNIGLGDNTQLNVRRAFAGTVMANKGFVVEADDLIYVSARVIAGNQNHGGEIVTKGLAALGTQFRIGGLLNTASVNYDTVHYTFISVLATENNTTVSFSDIKEGAVLINNEFAGNLPQPVVLNSGESFVLAVEGPHSSNKDALIGSLVSSDKPIAVNCGSFGGTNGEMNNIDLGFDQIVSAERTGKDYIFIKSTGMNNVERILLVAHEDNTEIFLGANTTPTFTIDAGEYVATGGAAYASNGNLYVRTSKNVFAYQSIGDNGRPDQANQEMFFVPPLSCETPRIIDNIPALNMIGNRVFNGRVTLITETGSTLNFVINGDSFPLAGLPNNISVTGPTPVTGNPDYVTYIITGLDGNVSVISSGQLYLASYGSSDAATFGGFYSGFTFKPEIAFNQLDVQQPNCLPNVVLSVNPLTAFDIFQWYFNDTAIPGATTGSINPTLPGYYHVSATIGACGTTLISDKIPVSSCATNVDGDLANDNIDLDNDNDGIDNCTESYGNQPFPLSNPLGGTIAVGSYTNTFGGSFPAGSGAPDPTPFQGQNNGDFVTATTAGKGNSVIYRADFATPLSVSLEYATAAAQADLLTSNAEFAITVPVDKTITVLNPSNQLLIDTNYDGIYESGVTQHSSFELRFRRNGATPLAAGTGDFSFRAHLVDHVIFSHINLNEDSPSRATFRLLATCVPRDTDNDGVYDQFDQDSDNDGLPDLMEALGAAFEPLANADDNADGLDNIFGGGIVPADTDMDGVMDFVDLDSDNDGIYDLVESGAAIADADNNGIADGTPAQFGPNGLLNAIENSAGSATVNYVPADSDGDGVPNYIELDSDNDLCNDTREAGFADPDNDGYLGSGTPAVNAGGVVTGSGGYLAPNPEYVNPKPIEILSIPQTVTICENQNAVIGIETNPGVGYQWQLMQPNGSFANLGDNALYSGATTSQLTINNVPDSMDGNIYRVLLSRPGNVCGMISPVISLEINPLPTSVSRILVQCETGFPADGITLFDLSQADSLFTENDPNVSVAYFLNQAGADLNESALPQSYTNVSDPQQIVVRVTNNTTGCYVLSFLNLQVNTLANQSLNLPEQCDSDGVEDGFHLFDLTQAPVSAGSGQAITYYESENDALLEDNPIGNPSAYQNLTPYGEQIVYARVENAQGCARIARIRIKVNPLPDIDVNEALENHLVCVNTPTFSTVLDPAFLDGSNPEDYSYQWFFEGWPVPGGNSPTLTVTTEGLYTVQVTDNNGCSDIRYVPVLASSTAIIESIDIVDLTDWNTVTVNLTSNSYGNYVFALNHMNTYQSSNVFNNVPSGIHTVYIKDLNGCPIASQVIAVTGIPNYFTPNGDGFNDTWNVKGIGSGFNTGTVVHIFDRYGKLIKQLGADGQGWDGTFNGKPLPSTDYWYVVKLADGRMVKGHFALKR